MSIINHYVVFEEGKQRKQRDLERNLAIADEIVSLHLEIENFKDILMDNLMFDYFTLDSAYLEDVCFHLFLTQKMKIIKEEILNFIMSQLMLLNITVESELDLELFTTTNLSIEELCMDVTRINKRLILSKLKAKYPDVYKIIEARAVKTIEYALGELV